MLTTSAGPALYVDSSGWDIGIFVLLAFGSLASAAYLLISSDPTIADGDEDGRSITDPDPVQPSGFKRKARFVGRLAMVASPLLIVGVISSFLMPGMVERANRAEIARTAWVEDMHDWASDTYGAETGFDLLIDERSPKRESSTGIVLVVGSPQNVTLLYLDDRPFLMAADGNTELPHPDSTDTSTTD